MRILSTVLVLVLLVGCGIQAADTPPVMEASPDARLADGPVFAYASTEADGSPAVIGLSVSGAALEALPTDMTDQHHCFDRDGDGTVVPDSECLATHERVVPLPTSMAARDDVPFKWVLVNWNPMGHIPPGIYDTPHFDIHFMIEPVENIFAIESGACGPEFVRCDQFEMGRAPVPAEYLPEGFVNFDAVVPAMGNHLFDSEAAELHGAPFTRTWIFGAYEGRITFYEEMVANDYLRTQPNECFEIKQPAAYEIGGYYPTESCFRYDADADAYTVSMESFVLREATPRSMLASAGG